MRPKPQNFIIAIDVYPFDVMISIDETDDVLFKKLKKYGYGYSDSELEVCKMSGLGRTVMLGGNQTVVRIQKQNCHEKIHGVIAHEIFHAAEFILNKIGMTLNQGSSDEAYAYLIGFLTEKFYEKFKIK